MVVKVAIVTGGGSGFGRALSIALAQRGTRVLVCDIDQRKALETCGLCENERARSFQCDVTRSDDLKNCFDEAVREFGCPVSVFINNAGIALPPGQEFDSGSWKKMIQINLTAVIEGTQLASTHMISAKVNGVILNVASAAGIWPQPATPVYAAVKAGVIHFTRSLHYLQQSEGVRVVCLAPTFFETPLLTGFRDVVAAAHTIMSTEEVVNGAIALLDDSTVRGGSTLIIQPGKRFFWPEKRSSKL